MEVFAEGAYPDDETRSAVTIGVYDGVHVGHRHVLRRLCETAAARGLRSAVVTFDPHPASIVAPERAPLLLTSVERRLELLAALGIDRCVVVGFDESVATEPPASFVERVLVDELHAAVVVVGEDFRFGHDRAGDVALLRAVAATVGFEVVPVALDGADGQPISSSRIREDLARGDVAPHDRAPDPVGAASATRRPTSLSTRASRSPRSASTRAPGRGPRGRPRPRRSPSGIAPRSTRTASCWSRRTCATSTPTSTASARGSSSSSGSVASRSSTRSTNSWHRSRRTWTRPGRCSRDERRRRNRAHQPDACRCTLQRCTQLRRALKILPPAHGRTPLQLTVKSL